MSTGREHILDYLEGRLDEEQQALFERELKSDPALRAELEDYKVMLSAFKKQRLENKMERLRKWKEEGLEVELVYPEIEPDQEQGDSSITKERDPEPEPVIPKPARGAIMKKLAPVLAIAASVLLLIFWQIDLQHTRQVQAKAMSFYQKPEIVKKASDATNLYVRALNAYQKDSISVARVLLDSITDGSMYLPSRYLLAHVCFNDTASAAKERYQCVIGNLEAVQGKEADLDLMTKLDQQFLKLDSTQVKWYLAVSYLADRQIKRGKELLRELKDPNGNLWQQEAEKLWNDL